MKFFTPILALVGILAAVTALNAPGATATSDAGNIHSFWRYVDKSGDIKRPPDQLVRQHWVHLGSWAIPDVKGASGPGIHDVYTERWVLEAFNKTHKWPDGAVLVKQVHAINKGARTTGPEVYWEGQTAVWFVMVKNDKNRFKNDPRWAEGWGWALFKADKPNTNISTTFKGKGLSNCFGCHVPAMNTDWVYVEGYPVLHLTAKQKQMASKH